MEDNKSPFFSDLMIPGENDQGERNTLDKSDKFLQNSVVIVVLYAIQAAVLATCASVRYFGQRDVGQYHLQATRRPRSYIYKAALHYAIGACLIIVLISYSMPGKGYTQDDIVRISVTLAQGACWLFSGLIMRFEFRRAIGHVWQMHTSYLTISICIYLTDLLYDIFVVNKHHSASKEHGTLFAVQLLMTFLILICTITLDILVAAYPRDVPIGAGARYVYQGNAPLDSLDEGSRASCISFVSVKRMPILTAKVTSQISIDKQNNQENVLFQIIVKENGNYLKTTKKTYQNFRSLDDTLTYQYSRQITRGQLKKRPLPTAGNMSSISDITQLREQLNLYLQEILQVSYRQSTTEVQQQQLEVDQINNINNTIVKETNSKPNSKPNGGIYHLNRSESQNDEKMQPLLISSSNQQSFDQAQQQAQSSNKDSGVAEDLEDQPLIEFETDKNSRDKQQQQQIDSANKDRRRSAKGEKTQNFLPKELLRWFDLEPEKVDDYMSKQLDTHPSFALNLPKTARSTNQAMTAVFTAETQKDVIHDEVKKLIIDVCSQDEFFNAKLDIAPNRKDGQLTFLIKINNDQNVFEKSISELIQFCQEMNMWAEGKNAVIEQLYIMVQDTFQVNSNLGGAVSQSQSIDPLVQGLAGPPSANTSLMNISMVNNPNQSTTNISADYRGLSPKNIEEVLSGLEDSFWYMLNNPSCYCEIIYRWFDNSSLFVLFPHCEAFFKTYRLTGRTSILAQPPNQAANILTGGANSSQIGAADSRAATGLGALEEIVEVNEELELRRDTDTLESKTRLGSDKRPLLISSTSLPSDRQGMALAKQDSLEEGHSFQPVTDYPYQPIDIIEWVLVRVQAITNKVLIGQNGNAFTLYEMEITQRIELPENKNAIGITRRSGDPDSKSNFDTKVCHIRFGVKELFQMTMFYCQSFTEDDIPDRLWQEAEYGINQEGNDAELENLLNYKILKNLEVILHPGMRHFFDIGRDKSSLKLAVDENQIGTNTVSHQAQNDEMLMGRNSSFTAGFGAEDRSSTSLRWQSNILPSNVRMSKTRGWIAEQQFDAYKGGLNLLRQSSSEVSKERGNQTVAVIKSNDLAKQSDASMITDSMMGYGMGAVGESPLDPGMLPKQFDDQTSDRDDFGI